MKLSPREHVNNTNNYRGTFLNNVSSKLYSSIIKSRLQESIEKNNITGDYQASFKEDDSAIDHIFTDVGYYSEAVCKKIASCMLHSLILKKHLIQFLENYSGQSY